MSNMNVKNVTFFKPNNLATNLFYRAFSHPLLLVQNVFNKPCSQLSVFDLPEPVWVTIANKLSWKEIKNLHTAIPYIPGIDSHVKYADLITDIEDPNSHRDLKSMLDRVNEIANLNQRQQILIDVVQTSKYWPLDRVNEQGFIPWQEMLCAEKQLRNGQKELGIRQKDTSPLLCVLLKNIWRLPNKARLAFLKEILLAEKQLRTRNIDTVQLLVASIENIVYLPEEQRSLALEEILPVEQAIKKQEVDTTQALVVLFKVVKDWSKNQRFAALIKLWQAIQALKEQKINTAPVLDAIFKELMNLPKNQRFAVLKEFLQAGEDIIGQYFDKQDVKKMWDEMAVSFLYTFQAQGRQPAVFDEFLQFMQTFKAYRVDKTLALLDLTDALIKATPFLTKYTRLDGHFRLCQAERVLRKRAVDTMPVLTKAIRATRLLTNYRLKEAFDYFLQIERELRNCRADTADMLIAMIEEAENLMPPAVQERYITNIVKLIWLLPESQQNRAADSILTYCKQLLLKGFSKASLEEIYSGMSEAEIIKYYNVSAKDIYFFDALSLVVRVLTQLTQQIRQVKPSKQPEIINSITSFMLQHRKQWKIRLPLFRPPEFPVLLELVFCIEQLPELYQKSATKLIFDLINLLSFWENRRCITGLQKRLVVMNNNLIHNNLIHNK